MHSSVTYILKCQHKWCVNIRCNNQSAQFHLVYTGLYRLLNFTQYWGACNTAALARWSSIKLNKFKASVRNLKHDMNCDKAVKRKSVKGCHKCRWGASDVWALSGAMGYSICNAHTPCERLGESILVYKGVGPMCFK